MAETKKSRRYIRCIVIAMGIGFATSSQGQDVLDPLKAAEPNFPQAMNYDGVPGGVVLNRTMTIVGHDFYQYFATTWRTRNNTERYSITIVERPTAIRGSEIWVEYRNKRVFRTFVSPRRSAIRDISRRAVGLVYNAIVEKELQQLLYHDHDLAKEELQ